MHGSARAWVVVIAAAGGTAACTERQDDRVVVRSLAEAGARLAIGVSVDESGIGVSVAAAGTACVVLDASFTGSIAGVGPPQITGGTDSGPDFPCEGAGLTFPPWAPAVTATLRIADATRTVDVSLGDGLVPRTVALVTPADRHVAAGSELVLAWTPAADLAADPTLTRYSLSGRTYGSAAPSAPIPLVVRDGELVGTAPALPAGDGELALVFGGPVNGAAPCVDATCRVSASLLAIVPVTFGP